MLAGWALRCDIQCWEVEWSVSIQLLFEEVMGPVQLKLEGRLEEAHPHLVSFIRG